MASFFEPACRCGATADEETLECSKCGAAGSVIDVGARLVMQLARECLEGEDLSKKRLQVELADARAVLRRLCDDHGDNDWDDDLYLADALEKHLGNYLT